MSIVLFDSAERNALRPFTYTRAIADIRFGIFTRKEWWRLVSGKKVYVLTDAYLQSQYGEIPTGKHIFIDAAFLPDADLLKKILVLTVGRIWADDGGQVLAAHVDLNTFLQIQKKRLEDSEQVMTAVQRLTRPWQLFLHNDAAIRQDYTLVTRNRKSEKIPKSNHVVMPENIFIEKGAQVEFALLNASQGPIYIGRDAVIMEGACLRGPIAIGEGSVVKMGAKIYGGTSVGPYCTLGGEVKNAILMGYSNKAHDGYLGDAVIGYWCNIGGGTTNSNVKNTAASIEMTVLGTKIKESVGRKAGVIMGDYTRVAINSSINTGSLYGCCCNVFGAGLLPKSIPNFSWGVDDKTKYKIDKAIQDINQWMAFKQKQLNQVEIDILKYIFDHIH